MQWLNCAAGQSATRCATHRALPMEKLANQADRVGHKPGMNMMPSCQ